jgi:hypothetical protein
MPVCIKFLWLFSQKHWRFKRIFCGLKPNKFKNTRVKVTI